MIITVLWLIGVMPNRQYRYLHHECATINAEADMRTTVTLDEELVAKAAKLTGIEEHSALVRAALETLVRVENGRLLATLGGSEPQSQAAPRHQDK